MSDLVFAPLYRRFTLVGIPIEIAGVVTAFQINKVSLKSTQPLEFVVALRRCGLQLSGRHVLAAYRGAATHIATGRKIKGYDPSNIGQDESFTWLTMKVVLSSGTHVSSVNIDLKPHAELLARYAGLAMQIG